MTLTIQYTYTADDLQMARYWAKRHMRKYAGAKTREEVATLLTEWAECTQGGIGLAFDMEDSYAEIPAEHSDKPNNL